MQSFLIVPVVADGLVLALNLHVLYLEGKGKDFFMAVLRQD